MSEQGERAHHINALLGGWPDRDFETGLGVSNRYTRLVAFVAIAEGAMGHTDSPVALPVALLGQVAGVSGRLMIGAWKPTIDINER